MGRMGRIELQDINTDFDLTTDCPFWNGFCSSGGVLGSVGADPDSACRRTICSMYTMNFRKLRCL